MPLTSLARTLGYRTVVLDGRPRFATTERFPDVDELKIGIPSELVTGYPFIPSTALVLVAHDYKYDLPVLRHALATPVGYIGMLGSARRGAAILKLLREEGLSEESLARVRVPIGLDIGARSAPEIALAVLAEIQAVRHRHLRGADERQKARMKAIAQRRDTATPDVLLDRVLCHDVRDGAGRIAVPKGERLDAPAIETLLPRHGRRSTCSPSSRATSTRRRPAAGWLPRSPARVSR
jgi:hypothetical protein